MAALRLNNYTVLFVPILITKDYTTHSAVFNGEFHFGIANPVVHSMDAYLNCMYRTSEQEFWIQLLGYDGTYHAFDTTSDIKLYLKKIG